jgi:hypothetical protein
MENWNNGMRLYKVTWLHGLHSYMRGERETQNVRQWLNS